MGACFLRLRDRKPIEDEKDEEFLQDDIYTSPKLKLRA
jgi:hypothetical protein